MSIISGNSFGVESLYTTAMVYGDGGSGGGNIAGEITIEWVGGGKNGENSQVVVQ